MNRSRRNSKRSRRNHRSRRRGGMAPVNYSTVSANPQPSERVMQWATTAGAPAPSAAEMRNVAHGGRRRSMKRRSNKRRSNKRASCRRKRRN
jgi:hypothetical protein